MEQHDQLTGWRPGRERVKDQPTGRDLERFDHAAWSPRPSVSLLAHLDLTAETAPELNREPLAVEGEPDVHHFC